MSKPNTMKLVLLMATCLASGAAPNAAQADAADTISAERLLDYIEVLASDEFAGRLPGTEGGLKTEAYIANLWHSFGVEPANNGSFYQEVRLAGVRPISASDARVARGESELVLINREDIVFSGSGVSEVAAVTGSELVFVGYGITAPEYGWDDYAGADVEGKTVVALWGDPGLYAAAEDPGFFKGAAATIHGMSSYKAEQAAAHGASGILLIHDEALAGWPWQVAIQGFPGVKYRIAEPREPLPTPKIGGMLSGEVAGKLFSFAGLDLDSQVELARSGDFEAVPLGADITMSVVNELSEVSSNNVVGIIPGATRPDEYVLYTAHWDHVGTKPDMEGDNIFNGAMDNATGTAGISEIARVIAGMETKPDRSVVFIATTAEEQGLLGAFYYTDNPIFPLARTAGVFNMDAHYPYGEYDGMVVVGQGNSELENYIEDAAVGIGRETYPNPSPEQGAFYRSDHYPFAKAGVPSIYAVGAPLPHEGEEPTEQEKLMSEYGATKYHKPGDEIEPDIWDLGGVVQDVTVYLRAGLALANDTRWPNWYFDNEFRARRDNSLASR
jgi:Zn-dependent M28 family amino/carboxypeptidase